MSGFMKDCVSMLSIFRTCGIEAQQKKMAGSCLWNIKDAPLLGIFVKSHLEEILSRAAFSRLQS